MNKLPFTLLVGFFNLFLLIILDGDFNAFFKERQTPTIECLSNKDKIIIDALLKFNFTRSKQNFCLFDDALAHIEWPFSSRVTKHQSKQNLRKPYCKSRVKFEGEHGNPLSLNINITDIIKRHNCHTDHTGDQPTAAVCAIIRNEAPIITEWVLHHLLVGFKHVYVFDDCSEDNLSEVMAPFIDAGYATLLFHEKDHVHENQGYAYNYCHEHYKSSYDYLAYLDGDEFYTPLIDNCVTPVLKHADEVQAGGISFHRPDFGHEGDVVATHNCKIRTSILGPYRSGFHQVSKVLCHTTRSNGAMMNMPHCCAPQEKFPIIYPFLDKQKYIEQDECYAIVENVRGEWKDMMAFIQHRPIMSYYDKIMKSKRDKYGTNHGVVFKNKHLSLFENYRNFMNDYNKSTWLDLPEEAAKSRSNLFSILRSALELDSGDEKKLCAQLEANTAKFHQMIQSEIEREDRSTEKITRNESFSKHGSMQNY